MQSLTQSPIIHLVVDGDNSPVNQMEDFELTATSTQSSRKLSDSEGSSWRKKFRSQDFTEQLYKWNDYLVKRFETKQL